MPVRRSLVVLTLLIALTPTSSASDVAFNRQIRPILAKHCFACHGSDENKREAELRLDDGSAVDGATIDAGKPSESELIRRIQTDDQDLVMPPPSAGGKLSDEAVALLSEWIASGAAYEQHWSFVPPVRPDVPAATVDALGVSPIDRFVQSELARQGLAPSPAADKIMLLRRVALDLTGLPPTLEEADAFLSDDSPTAYENLVDRLLGKKSYGEHWTRMWLDLARYADTKGYEKDRHRDMWPYRDWVIDALNQDMPFDEFTEYQLAGDLLEGRTDEMMIATAFHRNTMTNEEGGTDDEEFRVAAVKDRVDTTINVWMGLTMGCAKCHSHKYDPITIKDYYGFYAFFNQTQDADREAPLWPVKVAGGKPIQLPVIMELAKKKQRETRIHNRGNFLDPGEPVTPELMTQFGVLADIDPGGRLGVARWLTHPDNPLTARVMANRIWARLFGVGLVETEEDFGTQGAYPSHPQLLDWLAVEYREQNWSLKHLLRTIVLSHTYRQTSVADAERLETDPKNRLLSRGPRFRLPAETLRDQALAVSGLLTTQVGGPSVMPPQPSGIWKSTYNQNTWKNAEGPNRFRRGIYTYRKRTSPYPSLQTFDAGSGEVCQIRRIRTNTPLQALVTLNDTVFVEAAGALAARMQHHEGALEDKITHGFRLVLIREPKPAELEVLTKLDDELGRTMEDGPSFANAAAASEVDPHLIAIASVLLNLDETLMKP